VLGRTRIRAFAGSSFSQARLRLGTELCAIYWHFMLIVWLVLFALFAGWANDFVDLCRQLVS
jgi:cytochrome c oxidase subunit 3